jgi:uncharacterized protein YodC (DUF2158 family)
VTPIFFDGDLVVHKSNLDQPMVVLLSGKGICGKMEYRCEWIDKNGNRHTGVFYNEALEKHTTKPVFPQNSHTTNDTKFIRGRY